MSGREVEKIPKLLHTKKHYAKFFRNNEIIVVYPSGIFLIDRKNKSGLKEAYEEGKKLQIGDDHLNNLIPKNTPKRKWSEVWNDPTIPHLPAKGFFRGLV